MRLTKPIMLAIAIPLAAGLAGCSESLEGPDSETFTFSFDQAMQGWTADGTDLTNPTVAWSVQQSAAESNNGAGSVRIFLDNLNDAGKVWMERSFELEPNRTYDVDVSYAFGSADWGDINLWRIITGVTTDSPEEADDLEFQDDTGNGLDSDNGIEWMNKTYSFTATTDAAGVLHVAIGTWGTFEVQRTYFVDDVKISFSEM
jgi:hypothetical protein